MSARVLIAPGIWRNCAPPQGEIDKAVELPLDLCPLLHRLDLSLRPQRHPEEAASAEVRVPRCGPVLDLLWHPPLVVENVTSEGDIPHVLGHQEALCLSILSRSVRREA